MNNNSNDESVINDTVLDLPKLKGMTADERHAWWRSLGTLERKQLSYAAGVVVGLAFGEGLAGFVAASFMAALKAKPPKPPKPRPRR